MLLNRTEKKNRLDEKWRAGVRGPEVCIKHGEWETRTLVESAGYNLFSPKYELSAPENEKS